MQTSFHVDGLDFPRVPDVSGPFSDARRYSASGESLDALKARTTPIDNTNPYTSPHASCANAFIATAISIEHRYDEIHLQLPVANNVSAAVTPSVVQQVNAFAADMSPQVIPDAAQPIMYEEFEPQWNFDLLEPAFSSAQPEFWLPQASPQLASAEVTALPEQTSSDPRTLPQVEATVMTAHEVTISNEYQEENGEVTFSGDASAGTLLNFYLDDLLIGSTEVDNGGRWQFELPTPAPIAEHIFSAVPISPQGVVGSKVDFPFIINPTFGAVLMPIDESELDMMDKALIELVAPQVETTVTTGSWVLTEEMLDGWRTLDRISAFDTLPHASIFDVDELELASADWS